MEITQDEFQYFINMFQQRDEIIYRYAKKIEKLEKLEKLIEALDKEAISTDEPGCYIHDLIRTLRKEGVIND